MNKSKVKKAIFCFLIIALLFLSLIIVNNFQKRSIAGVAHDYFSNLLEKNYQACMNILYFKDEHQIYKDFTLTAYKEDPLLSYKVERVSKLSKKIYTVDSHVNTKINGEQDVTNYLVFVNGTWRFVINKRDVPDDVYTFSDIEEDLIFVN